MRSVRMRFKDAIKCSACWGGRLVQNAMPKITAAPSATSAAFQPRASQPGLAPHAACRRVQSLRPPPNQRGCFPSFPATAGSSSSRLANRAISSVISRSRGAAGWPHHVKLATSCRHSGQPAMCRAMRQRSQRPRSPPANSAIWDAAGCLMTASFDWRAWLRSM